MTQYPHFTQACTDCRSAAIKVAAVRFPGLLVAVPFSFLSRACTVRSHARLLQTYTSRLMDCCKASSFLLVPRRTATCWCGATVAERSGSAPHSLALYQASHYAYFPYLHQCIRIYGCVVFLSCLRRTLAFFPNFYFPNTEIHAQAYIATGSGIMRALIDGLPAQVAENLGQGPPKSLSNRI